MMQKYLVVFEKVPGGYSADLPDVPGCVATGESMEEAARNIRAALRFHFEGLREDGAPLPEPNTAVDSISVD